MDIRKKQAIKDRYLLNKIQKDVENIEGISILHIYNSANIDEEYLKILDKIYRIEFPILFTREIGNSTYEYVEFLYKFFKLPFGTYNWLIPNFNGSNWWLELKIDRLTNFINFYCPDNNSINLTIFDKENNLLFDIEIGETSVEYRMMWL